MNTRSLRFQLVVWYAAVLTGCFAVLGAATYFALQSYLVSALKETQLRRARQISKLLNQEIEQHEEARLGEEIEARYAPGSNNRFVRVSRDGEVLYTSKAPEDKSFNPASFPRIPSAPEGPARREALPNGGAMLLVSDIYYGPRGKVYLVETGAPLDAVQADLRQWLKALIAGLPIAAVIAIVGGSILVKRALSAADQITASAERISSHNLSERLPG